MVRFSYQNSNFISFSNFDIRFIYQHSFFKFEIRFVQRLGIRFSSWTLVFQVRHSFIERTLVFQVRHSFHLMDICFSSSTFILFNGHSFFQVLIFKTHFIRFISPFTGKTTGIPSGCVCRVACFASVTAASGFGVARKARSDHSYAFSLWYARKFNSKECERTVKYGFPICMSWGNSLLLWVSGKGPRTKTLLVYAGSVKDITSQK